MMHGDSMHLLSASRSLTRLSESPAFDARKHILLVATNYEEVVNRVKTIFNSYTSILKVTLQTAKQC